MRKLKKKRQKALVAIQGNNTSIIFINDIKKGAIGRPRYSFPLKMVMKHI